MHIKIFKLISIFILSIVFTNKIYSQNYTLQKAVSDTAYNYSGSNQIQNLGEQLPKPFRLEILKDGKPAENIPVTFKLIFKPENSKDYKLDSSIKTSNKNGIVLNHFTLGNKIGDYIVEATVNNEFGNSNTLIFKSIARKSNWIFILIVGILGGLSIFLYGMNIMSAAMQKSAGNKMRSILSSLTNNRFIAVGVGTFVTMIIQSSSATSVMLVSFVYAGLMTFSQSLGILLGAGIGTTITAQLIAFKLTDYALSFIALGFFTYFLSSSKKVRNIGKIILGFGLLFFGMHIMSSSMTPLRTYEPFLNLLLKLENPILGILFGAGFTAVLQSSSASIGIIIILATQGLISIEAGIPLILGANIGTSITAIIASINTNREAVKVALAQTFFKVFGVLIFIWWIPSFQIFIEYISPKSGNLIEDVPRQIANTHTIFNILLTLIALPLLNTIAKLFNKVLPEKQGAMQKKLHLTYIDKNYVLSPTLSLNLAKQEVLIMGGIVKNMIEDIKYPFLEKNKEMLKEIQYKEKKVNFLRDEIKAYVLNLSSDSMNEEQQKESYQLFYVIKELEHIADIVSKSLSGKAEKWIDSSNNFSKEGIIELTVYHLKAIKQISRALEVFEDINLEKAEIVKEKWRKYRSFAKDLEWSHYERLTNNTPHSLKSSKIHIEMLTYLRGVQEHSTNIAKSVLEI